MMTAPAAAAARREIGRDLGAGRGQHDVDALEVEVIEALDLQHLLFAEGDVAAGRALRRQGDHFVDREIALRQRLQHLAAHIARGADHRYPITHDLAPSPKSKKGRILLRPLGSSDPL